MLHYLCLIWSRFPCVGGGRSCHDNQDAAKPFPAEKLPMPPAACHAQALTSPWPRGWWGWRGATWTQGHPADPHLAPEHFSHSEHPNKGGQSSPVPEAPGLQHTRASKRPDWGGFSHCCPGSPSRTERLQTCHLMSGIKGKRHFSPEQDLCQLP